MTNEQNTPVLRGKENLPIHNPAFVNLRDAIARATYGMSVSEAIAQTVCISCNGVAMAFRDALSTREYRTSGLCQSCQDAVFKS